MSVGAVACWVSVALFSLFASGCGEYNQMTGKTDPPFHHGPNGFRNLYENAQRGFLQFLRWQVGLGPDEVPAIPAEMVPSYVPERVSPDLERILEPAPEQIQVTWIGHSTFLIQMDGLNILTDPVFSDRASPFSFSGPIRLSPPGVAWEDLPSIHAVILSHNHYDHLDARTVDRLGNGSRFFVPLGLARWFRERGTTNVVELDWWESESLGSLRFHSVPVQHFSNRSPFDRNQTLWTGWIVEAKAGKLFFAGDTGYSPLFREIGEKFNGIRVSLLPIGAYRPRWFMRPMHMDPPEAVKAHVDLRSKQSIAMHWGTFKLTDEPMAEPPLYLKKALKEAGLGEREFLLMHFGETLVFE